MTSWTFFKVMPWRIKIIFVGFGSSLSNSSSEPTIFTALHPSAGGLHFQTGKGAPQYLSREIPQSTFSFSHSPKRPSRKYSGCQSILEFSSSIFFLTAVVLKNQEDFA